MFFSYYLDRCQPCNPESETNECTFHSLDAWIPNVTSKTISSPTCKGSHSCTYFHRDVTRDDKHWCSNVFNSDALDELFQHRAWIRKDLDQEITLEMIADLNRRKRAIATLDMGQIHSIRLKSNATWTWIPDFQPLSAKWMLSYYLDHYLLKLQIKDSQTKDQIHMDNGMDGTSCQRERFHFRSWAVTAKKRCNSQANDPIPDGQYTIDEVLKAIKSEEDKRQDEYEKYQQNKNTQILNDWIPGDGYYVKPGGAMGGGGRDVNFVKNFDDLKQYLDIWVETRRKESKLGAICLVQQAMSNRRRMVWNHKDGIPKFYEIRAMAVITGKDNENRNLSGSGVFHWRQGNGLEDGSVHVSPRLRIKALPVPKKDEDDKALLLNKRRQEKANNNAHSCKDEKRSKATMFNSFSLEDLIETFPEKERKTTWIAKKMLPQIISAIHDTSKACCFLNEIGNYNGNNTTNVKGLAKGALLVCAFDFIIDVNGKPWLLEINVKPWLRWAGVNTETAYPHKLARSIASEVLEGLLDMIEASSIRNNLKQ